MEITEDEARMATLAEACNVDGTGELTLRNMIAYLNEKKYSVRYNEMLHVIDFYGFPCKGIAHLPNTAPTIIYDELHFILKKCTQQKIADFLQVIAVENSYNPILKRIQSVSWDGVDYFGKLLEMLHLEHDYTSEMLLSMWLRQCICALHNSDAKPFSLDIVLVLQGKQGIGKTRLLEALALDTRYFGEGVSLDPRNKDSQIQAVSKWICELGEISSTLKRDVDSLKAFISSPTDEIRLPYARSAIRYPRRTCFCGTTNESEFLADSTGNRRFAVIPLSDDVHIDYDKDIKPFNFLQLWAQMNAVVEGHRLTNRPYSTSFRLKPQTRAELEERNHSFEKKLKGEDEVRDVIAEQQTPEDGFTIEYRYMLTTEFIEHNTPLRRYSAQEVGKVLSKLGYEKKNVSIKGKSSRRYYLPYKYYSRKAHNVYVSDMEEEI